ncbi:hypothetical protein [Terasakiella sp. SH-1]|uniref:hypothetical protein n=1 Tax=Terasakiella sp. SH-1 TaxID=2560057 RepID=UPI001074296B|nr:hypothetical protein [Terasakiella sp. SH-1]
MAPKASPETTLKSIDVKLLYFLQRFRFLTAEQAVRLVGERQHSEKPTTRFRALQEAGYIAGFGGSNLHGEDREIAEDVLGQGSSCKVWYLLQKGYDYLCHETDIAMELLGLFHGRGNPRWSSHTPHRIKMIDVAIAFDRAIHARGQNIVLEQIYFDFDIHRAASGKIGRETDMEGLRGPAGPRVRPDLTLLLAKVDYETIEAEFGRKRRREVRTRRRIPIEIDCRTDTVLSAITNDPAHRDLATRYLLYDQILNESGISDLASTQGAEDNFVLLTVSPDERRNQDIRNKISLQDVDVANDRNFRFATFAQVEADPLGAIWLTRKPEKHDFITALEP